MGLEKIDSIVETLINEELHKDVAHRHYTGKNRRAFVKIFSDFTSELLNLSGIEVKVFLWLAMYMDFNKASYIMDEDFWNSLCKDLELSRDYARRIITSLKKKGFVYDNKFTLYIGSKYASKKKV